MPTLYDAVGLIGVIISVTCYARMQWRRDYAKSLSYSLLNFIGSVMILVSVCNNWNLPAFISNVTWGIISLYGVYRCQKYRWREKAL